jgi:hypothetical protein
MPAAEKLYEDLIAMPDSERRELVWKVLRASNDSAALARLEAGMLMTYAAALEAGTADVSEDEIQAEIDAHRRGRNTAR